MIGRLLNFDSLIGESLIKLLYYVGLLLLIIGGLMSLFAALNAFRIGFGAGFSGLLISIIGFVLGVLFWRFMCEMFIVVFSQYNKVSKIADAVVKKDVD